MRMDKQSNIDACKIINTYSSDKLATLFSNYGDFNNSFQISDLICNARDKKNIETTFELNKILEPIFPKSIFNKVLSRVYQTLRIEVNNEIVIFLPDPIFWSRNGVTRMIHGMATFVLDESFAIS